MTSGCRIFLKYRKSGGNGKNFRYISAFLMISSVFLWIAVKIEPTADKPLEKVESIIASETDFNSEAVLTTAAKSGTKTTPWLSTSSTTDASILLESSVSDSSQRESRTTAVSSRRESRTTEVSSQRESRTTEVSSQQESRTNAPMRYKLAVGIAVAKRNPPTIYRLLDEIFQPENDLHDVVVVVHVAYDVSKDQELLQALHKLRSRIHVHIQKEPHPQADPKNIPSTRGDTMERTIWRTTEVMDYAVLMKALLKFNASYNLILEDDVKPAKNAFAKSVEFAESQGNFGFLVLYSSWRRMWRRGAKRHYNSIYGTPAWLFSKEATHKVSEMLLSKPWWYPVDLQIPPFVVGTLRMAVYERNPNLFQHISKSSTYTGKDAAKRKAETWRSPSFEFDEDNNTAALTPSGPDGYIGCFLDHSPPRERDLINSFDLSTSNGNVDKCRSICKNSYYFGLQSGHQCFCGNEFGQYGRVAESRCNYICQQQKNRKCGGELVNSVYRVKPYRATFKGCYKAELLTHTGVKVLKTVHIGTVESCVNACGTHSLIGLVNGDTCHCLEAKVIADADVQTTGGVNLQVENRECNSRCHDYPGQVCGGASGKVAVYET